MPKPPFEVRSLLRDANFWNCVSDIPILDVSHILHVSYSTVYRARSKLGHKGPFSTICRNLNPLLSAYDVIQMRQDMMRDGDLFVQGILKQVIKRACFHKRFFPTMPIRKYVLEKIVLPQVVVAKEEVKEEVKEEEILNILFPDARTDPQDTTDYSWMQDF